MGGEAADPATALRVHAREELGVDPSELPSPILAAASSLAAFSSGALLPLLPYLAGLHSLAAAGAGVWISPVRHARCAADVSLSLRGRIGGETAPF